MPPKGKFMRDFMRMFSASGARVVTACLLAVVPFASCRCDLQTAAPQQQLDALGPGTLQFGSGILVE